MSDTDGTCEYVLDPDDPETWGGKEGDECYIDEDVLNEDDVWTCPHDAEGGENLCTFHRPVTEKDDEEVVEVMMATLEQALEANNDTEMERRSQFIGGRFGTIEIRDDTTHPCQIDLSHSHIEWFDVSKPEFQEEPTIIDVDINLAGSKCDVLSTGGGSWAYGATFKGAFDCRGMVSERFSSTLGEFHGPLDFRNAEFSQAVSLNGEFRDVVRFQDAEIDGALYIGATFDDTVDFRYASVSGNTSAEGGVEIDGDLRFARVSFGGDISFAGLSVAGTASFKDTKISGSADFRNASFGEASFANTRFNGDANFCDVNFGERVDMSDTSIDGESAFDRAQIKGDEEFRKFE